MYHKKNTYHHQNLRENVIKAALKLIETQGIEGVTLREVSRLVGSSHMAPYRHFKDKNELLAAVAEEGFKDLLLKMKQAVRGKKDFEKIKAVSLAYMRFTTKHFAHFRVMYTRELAQQDNPYPSLRAVEQEVVDFIHALIIECQESGLMVKKDPEEMSALLWCVLHGAADLYNNSQIPPVFSAKKLMTSLVEMAAHGFLKKKG